MNGIEWVGTDQPWFVSAIYGGDLFPTREMGQSAVEIEIAKQVRA